MHTRPTQACNSWDLRAEFALRLAALYGTEVPAYNTLVDVSREVNEDFIRRARGRRRAAGQHRPGHR